ncbi:sugar ABC transporter permease [Actinomadura sp. NBRC 104425]|uniref:carbohydrate ABC transporter permease n=1 Tax=Actinomadura sp. NBRC 104425 TaxID=3032204 RepID=UPI00249FFB86|nr:sugar ABC transporter permease [Actinomadura sp. NBRC 104425]GLZ13377.1 sugar ABC transporter permease [Actinomadura sp. NBRC 104425]
MSEPMAVSVRKSAPGRDAASAPARHRRAARSRRRLRERATIAAFLLPALVLFAALVLLPVVFALYTSLFRWGGFGWPDEFVGLDNFVRLFQDEVFLGDLWRGFVLIALSVCVQLPFALAMAVLLNQRLRGRAFYRLLFFAPYVLSEVITGVLFTMIFAPDSGLADHIMDAVGLGGLGIGWFASSSTVLPTVFLVMTWKYFGFHMILYLAGLQSIPKDVLEAASIDGAGAWQRFRYVTLPLLGPTIRISAFLSVIGAIQLFDLIWVTTAGGPVHSSETMAVTMFQFGFKRYQVGYASAISVVMFLISFVFALFYQRYVLRRDLEGAVTSMRGRR